MKQFKMAVSKAEVRKCIFLAFGISNVKKLPQDNMENYV